MWCAIYLGCLLIAGWAVVTRLGGGRSRAQSVGLIACLGPGVFGLCLIALSMLGFKPTRAMVIVLTLAFAVAGIAIKRPKAPPPGKNDGGGRAPRWWLGLCLIALGYSAYVAALDAFVYPTFDWDGFAIWQLKSKLLATQPLNPRPDYFTDVSRSFSHLRYPILVPMICAGEHVMSGRLDDELEKSPLFLLYIGMGAAVYGAIDRRRGGLAAITATTLLMGTQVMLRAACNGTADVPLAAFYACGLVCLLNWQEDRRGTDLALVALCSICMAWTKQEGIYLAVLNAAAVFAIDRRRPRVWIAFALAVGLAYLPWHVFAHPLPRTDEDYTGHLHVGEILNNLSRLGPVILGYLGSAFYWDNWCVFWFALFAIALLERERLRQPAVALLWILLIAHWLLNITPFLLVANWNYRELMWVTQDRLLLHTAPAAALLIGLQWPRLRRV
ncbi:MAG: hypothetical protein ABSF29_04675 [Tepidisphaeraceae bacterium]|jgi:hypothetical protein